MRSKEHAENESRYLRQKRRNEERKRHADGVRKLSREIVFEFEKEARETEKPCDAPEFPNPYTDWDSDEELREPYETDRPTASVARFLCAQCPLIDLCEDYANATGQNHGVWGGRRRERGRWVQ